MSIAAAASGTLTVSIWVAERKRDAMSNPVTLPAIGWLAALGVSAIFGLNPSESFGRLGKGLFPALVALAAWHASTALPRRRALQVLLASAAAAWVYGLAVFVAHGATFESRARGFVGHYMTFAGQIGLIASVAFAIAVLARGRWRIAAGLVATLGLVTLGATYTRSAWLGMLASLALTLGFARPRGLALLAGLAVLAGLAAPGAFRDRIDSMIDPHHPTNVERTHMWEAGLRMFLDHPVTGVGLQDLKPVYDRYRSPEARERAGHLHSVPVQVAATMGIVGLLAFAALYTGLIRCAAQGLRASLAAARAGEDGALAAGLRLGTLAGLTGFLVAGLFEWNFGDEELLHPLYLLAGMAWAARERS